HVDIRQSVKYLLLCRMSRGHMKKTQTDLLQGTLDLLALKTLQSGPTHDGTLRNAYSRSHRMYCGWARDRCIRRCTGWRRRAGLLPNGGRQRTTGRRNITN